MTRRLLAVPALLVLLALPDQAAAKCCSCVTETWRAQRQTVSEVNLRLAAMEATIAKTLIDQTTQLSGYVAQSSKAVTDGLDAQTKLQAQIARDVAETESTRRRRPTRSACGTATGMAGLAGSEARTREALARAGAAETGRIANDRAVVGAGRADADAASRFEVLGSTYCDPARAGPAGAGVCRGAAELHDADIRPATLFDAATLRDEAQTAAAAELGRNLAAPLVEDPHPLARATSPAAQRTVLLARARAARQALAADWFARARARRAPAADLGPWAAAMAPSAVRDPSRPISRHELLEVLASGRFADASWATGLQAMTNDNLLRELILVQAASLMLDWERYRMAELRGAMEAARLATGVEALRESTSAPRPSVLAP